MRTLVLDESMQPINIVTWQRAAGYLIRGRAEALEEYAQEVHADFQMPAVVKLVNGVKIGRRKVKFSRANVFARDRGKCQYCGRKLPASELTYEHVIPQSRGGKTVWENVVMACIPCNQAKADRTPAEADMRLLHEPRRPTWVPFYNPKLADKNIPPEWKDYWTIELEP